MQWSCQILIHAFSIIRYVERDMERRAQNGIEQTRAGKPPFINPIAHNLLLAIPPCFSTIRRKRSDTGRRL
jgi:hypothetical protein